MERPYIIAEIGVNYYDIAKQRNISLMEASKLMVKEAKQDSKKIVFTNGCFDLLHVGHITYLEEAKKLGDRLVVALNSDTSVRKLKGAKRPINKLKDRAKQIAALDCRLGHFVY